MSIDRLRYFAVVVETKSLRKAADFVGISAPSMSKAMSVLEEELGCKLIHSDGRGIGITDRGMEIYQLLTPLLTEHQNFHAQLRQASRVTTKLRIATFEVFSSHFISEFLLQEPNSKFLVLEKGPGDLDEAVLNGVVDIGLTYLPSSNPSLEYVEIGRFEMAIFGLKKWASLDFKDYPFAIPTSELRVHSSDFNSLDMWHPLSPTRNIQYEFELLETALQTSRRGLSVVHCPKFIVSLFNAKLGPTDQLVELPQPKGYKKLAASKAFIVWKKGSLISTSKLDRKFAKLFRSLS